MAKDTLKKKSKREPIIKVKKDRHLIITPVARLSFPQLFTARSFEDNPNEKKVFRCDLIVDSEDVWKQAYKGKKTQTISLKKAIRNCKEDQWGEDQKKWPHFEYDVIQDGNENTNDDDEIRDGYKDKSYIVPKSGEEFPPTLLLKNGKPATEEDLYAGCYVRAQILCRPYISGKNKGVSLRLVSIMKVDEGEKFGIGGDVFDIEEEEEEENENWDTTDDDEDDDI